MATARAFFLMALLGAGSACGRTERVAKGPIALTPTPQAVAFSHVVTVFGLSRELCLEFERPGDSHSAAGVHAVLITAEGRLERLQPTLDRPGEAIVCLVDVGRDPGTSAGSAANPVQYRAAELRSDVPVTLRSLRWYGGKPPSASKP